jgi:hypothetical protein
MLFVLLTTLGCDPYASWPEEGTYYPWVYTQEKGLEDYETVRWETETWEPLIDPEETGLYLLKALEHRPWAPVESIHHFGLTRGLIPRLEPRAEGEIHLSFVGDVMFTGPANPDTYTDVAHLLDGDVRLGNLETPVVPNEATGRDVYGFNASPEILESMPLDVVQLNNNHSLDLGDVGLEATLAAVEEAGLIPTGVDGHVLLGVGDARVAVLSFTWGLNERDVDSEHELFVIPFGHIGERIDLAAVRDGVAASEEAGADVIVAMVHWGFEYEYYPDPHMMVLGRELLSLGVDLVVGQGPHVAQPVELCAVNIPVAVPGVGQCSVRSEDGVARVGAILYSLGNFGTDMPTVPAQVGLVTTVALAPGAGVRGLGWAAVASVSDGVSGQLVVPLDDLVDDPEYAAEAARLWQHLGPAWKR